MDISGLDKGILLCRLMGWNDTDGPRVDEARVAAQDPHLDYFHGKPIKTNLTGDTANFSVYDFGAGNGAARSIVAALRGSVPQPSRREWDEWNALCRHYDRLIETTMGCGARVQPELDEHYEQMKAFVDAHPECKRTMPSRYISQNDGTDGYTSGVAATAMSCAQQ